MRTLKYISALWRTACVIMCAASVLPLYAGDIDIYKPPGPPEGFDPVKVTVSTSGIYYVSSSTLAGLMSVAEDDVKSLLESGGVSLRNNGDETGYLPDVNGNGVYFYGTTPDSMYTDDNVYWLRWYDGYPVTNSPGTPPSAGPAVTTSLYTQHCEEDVSSVIGFVDEPNEYRF